MIVKTADFQQLLDDQGLKYRDKGSRLEMLCPFHDDHSPSAAVYKDTQKFWCFTCELLLSIDQFYAKLAGESDTRSTQIVEQRYGAILPDKTKERKVETRKMRIGAERMLRNTRGGLDVVAHGRLGEQLDRIMWFYEQGLSDKEQRDSWMKLWFQGLQEVKVP